MNKIQDKIRRNLFHLINGIRSGIPICCVLFFMKRDNRGVPVAEHVSKERGIDPESWKTDNNLIQYVTCNQCFKTDHSVKIKSNGVIFFWLMKGLE